MMAGKSLGMTREKTVKPNAKTLPAEICSFENLYKAHRAARLGKRDKREVIDFEMKLAENLSRLSASLADGTYRMGEYYSFTVHDPKKREIRALHYEDRVVQHCICDEVLAPVLDKKLIYDNAACRIGKGTHFALERLKRFLLDFYKKHGTDGYFLKCDIRKFFDNIDHQVLKERLAKVGFSDEFLKLFCMIIDSFEASPGKGLPLGNQTSQWFAIYYLDGFDRLIKEKLRIKYYTRYMDDCVLICENKDYLKNCLEKMRKYLKDELKLELNEKTQIFPVKSGVAYLGFHTYITESGKVIRKVSARTKKKYKRRLGYMKAAYAAGNMELSDIRQVLASYNAHLKFGNTYRLRKKELGEFVLRRKACGAE